MQSRDDHVANSNGRVAAEAVDDDGDSDDYTDLDFLEDDDPIEQHQSASSSAGHRQNSFHGLKLPIPNSHLARFSTNPVNKTAPPLQTPRIITSRALNDVPLEVTSHNPSPDDKEVSGLDWYVEGPGKRVGYADRSAIDWIYEYGKERQRLRVLHSSTSGILGYLRQLVDTSQIWIILVFTGIATGAIAASIDVASDWLADMKTGICTAGPGGGRFYLNKSFCCWGLEEYSQCQDWYSWSDALGVKSRAGSWTVEYTFFVIFSVFFAACASLLVREFAEDAKSSGIPELKTALSGFVIKRFIGAWTLVIKSLGLCLSVASGLWLGKEGPLVHVACCCANLLLKASETLNSNEARKREVLSAAAAAGISVAFGSPVGGVLFSLEQLSYYFPDKTMWQSFVCAMVAAVTLQAFNPFRTGKLVLYQVTYSTGWHAFEMVPFALLGVLGGVYGGLFIKLDMKISHWRKSSSVAKWPIVEVVVVTLLTALINFPNRFMRAQSTEVLYTLFAECTELQDEQLGLCGGEPVPVLISRLLAAAILGFLLTSLTSSLRVPAGVLLPSMTVGALYGRALGLFAHTWQQSHPNAFIFAACEPDVPCLTAGTYAIVGAAAALAGATRMTVSIVVIMFELTGALTYVLPIMVSVMISKWVGDAFGKRGIYESWIHFTGYPFLDNRDDVPLPDVQVAHLMTRVEDLVCINGGAAHTLESLDRLLKAHPFRGFPIVSTDSLLLGYIFRSELTYALRSALEAPRSLPREAEAFFIHAPLADPANTLDLRPWMDHTPITLGARSSLQLTADLFLKLGLRYVLFCDRGRLMGLMTKKDLWFVLEGGDARMGANDGRVSEDYNGGEQGGLLNDERLRDER